MKILIDGDIVAMRCGFAAEKTRYDVYHSSDVTEGIAAIDGGVVYCIADGAVPVETFDNAKLCKEWMQVQDDASEHYTRVPRKEIDDVSHALHTVKIVMGAIETRFEDSETVVYFSCPTRDNWRTECYPEYKANRPDRKPFWYEQILDYMHDHYDCHRGTYHEADDLISMRAYKLTKHQKPWVIVSIDKDFLQIPGQHYNWVKEELVFVGDEEATRNLAVQRIMGDSVDNIKGCPGIGESKAKAHLFNSKAPTLDSMVADAYMTAYPNIFEAMHMEALTTAMVTLPKDEEHVQELMQEVFLEKQAYEEDQAARGDADEAGETALDIAAPTA